MEGKAVLAFIINLWRENHRVTEGTGRYSKQTVGQVCHVQDVVE